MKSRGVELLVVTLLLLAGFGVRLHEVTTNPAGFSSNEITSLRIVEIVKDGTIRVFYDSGRGGGVEGLYQLLQVPITWFIGDGLLGYRMLGIWGGLVSLALIYAVGRRLFGSAVGVVALVTMSFGLWPVIAARTAAPVSLISPSVMATIWIASQAYYLRQDIRPYYPRTVPYTLLALAIVVTTYIYYTGILIGVGIILYILYLRYSRQPVSRNIWWHNSYALTLAIILGLPYLISVLRSSTVSGLYVFWMERPGNILELFESAGKTLLAFFWRGDSNPTHNLPSLPTVSTFEGILIPVGIVISLIRWRQPNYGLILIVFFLGLLPDIWLRSGPDFTALAFANPLIYLLIGIGVVETWRILNENRDLPQRLRWLQQQSWLAPWPRPLLILFATLVVLALSYNIWRFQHHLYTEWPERPDTQQAYHTNVGHIALHLDHRATDTPVLVCSPQIQEVDVAAMDQPVSDQRLLEWMLHGEDIGFRIANCRFALVLLNGGELMHIIFTDSSDVATVPAPLQAWLTLAEPFSGEHLESGTAYALDAEQALADKGGQLPLMSTVFYPRETTQAEPVSAPYPVRFGGNMTLLGYEPFGTDRSLNPGASIPLVTYWRVDGPAPSNLGVFVRLHDTPQASPYAETNQLYVDSDRLHKRDVIVQLGYVTLPETLRQQPYQLTLGVYDGNPENQLPVYDTQTGEVRGYYLLMGAPFMVVSP
ncbi:MAG: hypothetical protein GYB66_05310 [Chloroflexi bacterium]|nr:hypothetical protein [Chloroflexota bacterium]